MPETPREEISFEQALTVTPTETGYTATVHPSWDGPLTTHGGLLAAILLRAIDAETNPDRAFQVRTLTCHYLRPPQHGEIDITVEPLRAGRRFSSARALISQNGKPCVAALSLHSVRELADLTSWSAPLPAVAGPPETDAPKIASPDYSDSADGWLDMPAEAPRFFQRLKIAPRFGTAPFMGGELDPASGTENGGWVALPGERPIDPELLVFLVDAFWPSVLQPLRTAAIAPTLDLTIHLRSVLPAAGLPAQPLLVHNTSSAVLDGTADSDSRIYSADGKLLAQGRQLQLVAPFT
jgi:acyl-CoA thioesterase